jgi:hypothetical protein
VYGGADGVSLRTAPNEQKVGALLQGSQFQIRGPSRDAGGFRGWPVAVEAGWIVEGPADPAQPRWLAPAQPAVLAPGVNATVVYAGAEGLNLRRDPGVNGITIATLTQGSVVSITGPAQIIDGVTWWPVHLPDGWMAEGATDPAAPRWLSLSAVP